MKKRTEDILKDWKPRRRRLVWREFYMQGGYDELCAVVVDIVRSEPGVKMYSSEPWVATNAPLSLLRDYARRYAGIRLPDYAELTEEEVIERYTGE
jgi:hypothetical protein